MFDCGMHLGYSDQRRYAQYAQTVSVVQSLMQTPSKFSELAPSCEAVYALRPSQHRHKLPARGDLIGRKTSLSTY